MTFIENKKADLTQSLISSGDLLNFLLAIFQDAIILDLKFRIVRAGELVLLDLGYNETDLRNKNISILADELHLVLEHQSLNGYFEEQRFFLRSKEGELLLAVLSGFYSGLFSGINGFIVLRYRNREEIKSVYRKLEAKIEELDQFIYQAAHHLRGPLTTIKGLIRIIKNAKDDEEIKFIINQINVYVETLDERLHKLSFLAEADQETSLPSGQIEFNNIESKLRETIQQHSPDCEVKFSFVAQVVEIYKTNDILITSLLFNLCSFLVSHPKKGNNYLQVDLFQDALSTEITIQIHGFTFCEETRKILVKETHGYVELLKRPDLIYCYATHKIINKMRGGISFNFLSNFNQVVIIFLPNSG